MKTKAIYRPITLGRAACCGCCGAWLDAGERAVWRKQGRERRVFCTRCAKEGNA